MQTTQKAAPILLERIDRLSGCNGHWILIRDGEPERDCHYQWHQVPTAHLTTCLAERWRDVSLGFVPSLCGYSSYSNNGYVGRANFNVLTDPATTSDPHGGILTTPYGWDGRGVVLDVLRCPADAIEAVEALESYPLLSEDEHGRLQLEGEQEAWDSWAARDWHEAICSKLAEYCPLSVLDGNQYGPSTAEYWADDQLDNVPDSVLDSRLVELFRACCESAGEYWEEDGDGMWIRVERVAAAVDRHDLVDLTGLPLLDPQQQWRAQPYPWPDGSTDPLAPSLA